MTTESRKHAVACCLGTVLGTLFGIGIHLEMNVDWWVIPLGFFLGGVLAYLAYDFGEVWIGLRANYLRLRGWRPDKEVWRLHAVFIGLMMRFLSIPIILVCAIGYVATGQEYSVVSGSTVLGIVFGVVGLMVSAAYGAELVFEQREKAISRLRKGIIGAKCLDKELGPIALCKYSIRGLVWFFTRGLWRSPRVVARFVVFCWCVAADTVRYIHSEARITCFCYAVVAVIISSSVGLYFGSLLIGMLVAAPIGAFMGLLGHRIAVRRFYASLPAAR